MRITAKWEQAIFHEAPLRPMGRRLAEESDTILDTMVPLTSALFVPLAQPISLYGGAQSVALCTFAATTHPAGLREEKPMLYVAWGAWSTQLRRKSWSGRSASAGRIAPWRTRPVQRGAPMRWRTEAPSSWAIGRGA